MQGEPRGGLDDPEVPQSIELGRRDAKGLSGGGPLLLEHVQDGGRLGGDFGDHHLTARGLAHDEVPATILLTPDELSEIRLEVQELYAVGKANVMHVTRGRRAQGVSFGVGGTGVANSGLVPGQIRRRSGRHLL